MKKKLYLIFPDGTEIYCAYGAEKKLQRVMEKCTFDDGARLEIR